MIKRITILPLALLFFSAGVVKSQAPVSGTTVTDLQALVTANKTLIDSQQATLDALDKLGQDADQLKTFAKRS
jgi:hypothetical protein